MAIGKDNGITASEINNEFPSVIDGADLLSKSINSYKGAVGRKIDTPNSIYVFPRGTSSIKYSDFDLFERKCRIDVLVIAGGGGGGSGAVVNNVVKSGGGGGAGGLNVFNNIVIDPNQDCTIRVGESGPGGTNGGGVNGLNSSFTVSGIVYRTLGGGGGGGATSGRNGAAGGSGGGGGGRLGTTGGEKTVSDLNDNRIDDGRKGGSGTEIGANSEGGGGGGKSGAGNNAEISGDNGAGGTGFDLETFMGGAWRKDDTLNRSVAGGGGGGRTTLPIGGSVGNDGGGRGADEQTSAEDGDNLTGGGGGGGCGNRPSGRGGNGLVVVRYRSTIPVSTDGTILTGKVNNIDYVFHVFKQGNEIDNIINFKILNNV